MSLKQDEHEEEDFLSRARRLMEEDREILDELDS